MPVLLHKPPSLSPSFLHAVPYPDSHCRRRRPPPWAARPWATGRIPALSHPWQQGLCSSPLTCTRPRRGAPPETGGPRPRIAAGGKGPPLARCCRGGGHPLTRHRHRGRGPLLGRRRKDEVLCSPTLGRACSLAAAAGVGVLFTACLGKNSRSGHLPPFFLSPIPIPTTCSCSSRPPPATGKIQVQCSFLCLLNRCAWFLIFFSLLCSHSVFQILWMTLENLGAALLRPPWGCQLQINLEATIRAF
jgi:hypothetical protein